MDVGMEEDLRWSRCDIKAITLLGNVMTLDKLSDARTRRGYFL